MSQGLVLTPVEHYSVDQLAVCIDNLSACTGELVKVVAALPAAMEQVIKASAMDQKTQLTDALSEQKKVLNEALAVLIASHSREWETRPLPQHLARRIRDHFLAGHNEVGHFTYASLTGSDYRHYLYTLPQRELMMEQCLSQMSLLTKIRQLEHDVRVLEDRSQLLTASLRDMERHYQRTTTDYRNGQEEARNEWAAIRDDWLFVQWRGSCLAGVWASLWAAKHWQVRPR